VQVNKDVLVCFTQVVSTQHFAVRLLVCQDRPKSRVKKTLIKDFVLFVSLQCGIMHIFLEGTPFLFLHCAETNQEVLVCFTEAVSFLSRLTKVTCKKDLDKGPCIVCFFAVWDRAHK
jgi:hypothetical protein